MVSKTEEVKYPDYWAPFPADTTYLEVPIVKDSPEWKLVEASFKSG